MTAREEVTIEGLYTVADAIKEVKRRYPGRKVNYCLSVNNDMPTVDPTTKEATGRVFPGALHTWVDLTKREALKVLARMGDSTAVLEARGGRVPVRVRHRDWGEFYGTGPKRYSTTIWLG